MKISRAHLRKLILEVIAEQDDLGNPFLHYEDMSALPEDISGWKFPDLAYFTKNFTEETKSGKRIPSQVKDIIKRYSELLDQHALLYSPGDYRFMNEGPTDQILRGEKPTPTYGKDYGDPGDESLFVSTASGVDDLDGQEAQNLITSIGYGDYNQDGLPDDWSTWGLYELHSFIERFIKTEIRSDTKTLLRNINKELKPYALAEV